MKFTDLNLKPLAMALMVASMLSACGGGGGGGSTSSAGTNADLPGNSSGNGSGNGAGTDTGGNGNPPATDPGSNTGGNSQQPGQSALTMSCVDAATGGLAYQCSGNSLLRVDNNVALTSSGVQVYGRSTSDLLSGSKKTEASGLAVDALPDVASRGLAEVRIARNDSGASTKVALLLSKLGLSWDGKNERPQIIETFNPTRGRTVLAANGAIAEVPLPESTDVTFYDVATKGFYNGTQQNYANNRYFPRAERSRCDGNPTCPTTETAGIGYRAGDWRNGGAGPDVTSASRLHEDGDVHAGNQADGTPLEGGNGLGVPMPGSKGYREFSNASYQYTNLASWMTQDTVSIVEWEKGGDEHNKNRRGLVAFGDVTNPASVPATGSATYAGNVSGWYSANGTQDPVAFSGNALVTVNFATRQAVVAIQNTTADGGASVPVTLSANLSMTNVGGSDTGTNYLTGAATNGSLNGGIGARSFGPVAGGAPVEIGGTFTLSNPTGAAVVAGFIGRKQ